MVLRSGVVPLMFAVAVCDIPMLVLIIVKYTRAIVGQVVLSLCAKSELKSLVCFLIYLYADSVLIFIYESSYNYS